MSTLPLINEVLREVPYTLHYWAVAPYGCDIGILLKPRQRVDETTDGSSGARSFCGSVLLGCSSMMRMPDRADR